jgi:transketolase
MRWGAWPQKPPKSENGHIFLFVGQFDATFYQYTDLARTRIGNYRRIELRNSKNRRRASKMAALTEEQFQSAATTIRGLAIDGIQSANSGHPGMPMGMADVAAVLWLKHLNHCPSDAAWSNRDRFVLSGGHGSMLIYSLLHLAGYPLPKEELGQFRQLGSLTPGHPEVGHTTGIETTTGPLGQGIANAAGMALAEKMLGERFNSEAYAPVDHWTYAFCGDGDMMEGISHEAFSLAGHLNLNKLVVFYDFNEITIEGKTELAYSDDVKKRCQSYGFNVIDIDGHDFAQIDRAIRKAKRSTEKPTLVICRTTIGQGSPNKAGTASAHGEPLGNDEVALTKQNIGLPADAFFHVSDAVYELFETRARSLKRKANKWKRELKAFKADNPEFATTWDTFENNVIPENLAEAAPQFEVGTSMATRAASGKAIQKMCEAIPQLVGGSADLSPSTKTLINDADSVLPGQYGGRNFHFGIREHGMAAIMNGMAVHGGLRVFGATFFVFVDYLRPALRLAALMQLPVIYVFTHDSFYVGEDGPTHQPVEQIASLRCIPGMTTIRPSDPTETAAAWVTALKKTDGPVAMLFTRQNLDVIDRTKYAPASELEKGAYVLMQTGEGTPDVTLIATGSEVALALKAAETLADEANIRVVSMPSWELFEAQSDEYKASVISSACPKRLVIEAAARMGWDRYMGNEGDIICMTGFGASGPYQELEKKFGFTIENVIAKTRALLG